MFDTTNLPVASWRELVVLLTCPAAFLTVFCMIWFGPLNLFRQFYFFAMFGGSSGVQSFPVYLLSIQYCIAALYLAFQIAILIRLATVGRQYALVFWRRQTPPHRQRQPESALPVIHGRAVRKARSKTKQWFGISLVTILLINIGYYEWVHFNTEIVLSWFPTVSLEVVGAVLTYLTALPVTPLGESVVSDMNSATLVSNAVLIWIPAIPLTIGFLNLNAYFYRGVQDEMFWWLRAFRMA